MAILTKGSSISERIRATRRDYKLVKQQQAGGAVVSYFASVVAKDEAGCGGHHRNLDHAVITLQVGLPLRLRRGSYCRPNQAPTINPARTHRSQSTRAEAGQGCLLDRTVP